MRSSWCQLLFSCSSVARGACCCRSFTTDSSLCATHPEETHTAAPCSRSWEFFWSTSSWSLPVPPSSGGCAWAVSPSSAASPPRASDYTWFKVLFFHVLFFFQTCKMWLKLWRGQTLPWTEGTFFECQLYSLCSNFSVYLSTVEDQLVMHWSFFSHLFNVTSFKRRTPSHVVTFTERSTVDISCVPSESAVIILSFFMSLFIHENYSIIKH